MSSSNSPHAEEGPAAMPHDRSLPGTTSPDASTRDQVLGLVAAQGPVSITVLAEQLDLTPAAVRRHVGALEESDRIEARDEPTRSGRRGRPAKCYVVTSRGQSELVSGYAEIATQALDYLAQNGEQSVLGFARDRLAEMERRYETIVTSDDITERTQQLAGALSEDGYVASVRPGPGSLAVQLCQGHCPVQHVAEAFPQLCEAEAEMFSRLLDRHTQRLATIAGGAHVCTTNVPINVPSSAGQPRGLASNRPQRPPSRADDASARHQTVADERPASTTSAVEGTP